MLDKEGSYDGGMSDEQFGNVLNHIERMEQENPMRGESETDKLSEALAELTEEERSEIVLEVSSLIRSEREWREAGCPRGKSLPNDVVENDPLRQPASASRTHRRRY